MMEFLREVQISHLLVEKRRGGSRKALQLPPLLSSSLGLCCYPELLRLCDSKGNDSFSYPESTAYP